jgi:predicted transcriptional regulator
MSRSKLETYLEILGAFSNNGSLKLAQLACLVNVNDRVLNGHVHFLIKQGLVEVRTVGVANVIFSATQQGINVLKYFHLPKQGLSIIE